MLVLMFGIIAGIDPLLATIRGVIGGMIGWVAGALWAFWMSQLMPPAPPQGEPTHEASPESTDATMQNNSDAA